MRPRSVGNQTFCFEDYYLGDVVIGKDNIAAWRTQTGIMILSEKGIEPYHINAIKERTYYKGARGLKIMLGLPKNGT